MAEKLGRNFDAKGKIILYTENPPCPSCQGVIQQFKQIYKNVEIKIMTGK
ncbi:MAG: hypothetical protein GY754_26515 [bacterium]|nr:hypothetical protein [bacterium]